MRFAPDILGELRKACRDNDVTFRPITCPASRLRLSPPLGANDSRLPAAPASGASLQHWQATRSGRPTRRLSPQCAGARGISPLLPS